MITGEDIDRCKEEMEAAEKTTIIPNDEIFIFWKDELTGEVFDQPMADLAYSGVPINDDGDDCELVRVEWRKP